MRVLICGSTGYGNIGDDCIRDVIVETIQRFDPTIEIKSTRPYPQKELIHWADKVIIGGGGILYDTASNPSNQSHADTNYEYFIADYLRWCVDHQKAVSLISVGTQLFQQPDNIKHFARLCSSSYVKEITVRQQKDYDWFEQNCREKYVNLGDDIGCLTRSSKIGFTAPYPIDKPNLCIIPNKANTIDYGDLIGKLYEHYTLYVACTSNEDMGHVEKITDIIGEHGSVRDFRFLSPSNMKSFLSEMQVVLSGRFHGLVLGHNGKTRLFSLSSTNEKLTNQLHPTHILQVNNHQVQIDEITRFLFNQSPQTGWVSVGNPKIHQDAIIRLLQHNNK